jgi:hypothetical protein
MRMGKNVKATTAFDRQHPANCAYLSDRIAASYNDPSKRKFQRYGTQGACTGPGAWEPLPVEDPLHLNDHRSQVGLEPEAEYIKGFKDICHSREY